MTVTYEACVTSVSQARAAARAGAGRLELCARIGTGGLTPPAVRIRAVREAVPVPVRVMIRPHAGDFRYDAAALGRMHAAIAGAREAGADGLVLGALDDAGRVNERVVGSLVAAAGPLPVTFHRAFDQVTDPLAALEVLVALGVDRVLTSGGAPTAREGAPMLRALVRAARGRITVIAAGTVRAPDVAGLMAATGVSEVHAHLVATREMRALAGAVAAVSAGS